MVKYIAWVEADAGITVEADNPEEAKETLEETVNTGHLGPPTVKEPQKF